MIYPTGRAVLLVATGAPVALVLGAVRPELWFAALAWIAGAGALLLFDAFSGASARDLDWRLSAPVSASVGETFALGIAATSVSGRVPGLAEVALSVDQRLAATGRLTSWLRFAGTGAEASLPVTAARRGVARIDRLWARWHGPLGLVWKQHSADLDCATTIVPDVRPVREEGVRLFTRDARHGLMARLDRGEGSEFQALVEYAPGMDRRAIDWKQSARHGELLAKEYRTERNNQIVFAIDSGRAMSDPLEGVPRIDRAVSAALLTAYVALKVGDRVSLFAFDSRPTLASAPMTGGRSFAALQRLAGRIEYSHEETNYTLALSTLGGRLDRRSLIVVFTDFTDQTGADLLVRAAGRLLQQHVVLFVVVDDAELEAFAAHAPETPADIARAIAAAALLRERRIVTARLRRLGIHIIEARHDAISTRLLDGYLAIKRRNLL